MIQYKKELILTQGSSLEEVGWYLKRILSTEVPIPRQVHHNTGWWCWGTSAISDSPQVILMCSQSSEPLASVYKGRRRGRKKKHAGMAEKTLEAKLHLDDQQKLMEKIQKELESQLYMLLTKHSLNYHTQLWLQIIIKRKSTHIMKGNVKCKLHAKRLKNWDYVNFKRRQQAITEQRFLKLWRNLLVSHGFRLCQLISERIFDSISLQILTQC